MEFKRSLVFLILVLTTVGCAFNSKTISAPMPIREILPSTVSPRIETQDERNHKMKLLAYLDKIKGCYPIQLCNRPASGHRGALTGSALSG